jgi:superfamily II DNA or RNA helicase
LSLTGTPWRTDTLPIPLASYSDPEGNIQCDFSYNLIEAVNDKVCRAPLITAIDTDQVRVRKGQESHTYQSIAELLESSDISYRMILRQPEIITYMLSLSIQKLDKLRNNSPNTGGLIVASSYQHALQIQSILYGHFGKEATIVSYRLDDSPELINRFREDTSEWIISIAMISEGTDIPRLQVCCNLTDVTTELYFRQILGRILRMTNHQTDIGYMFILAEPNLVEYAECLNEAIPGSYNYKKTESLIDSVDISDTTEGNQNAHNDTQQFTPEIDINNFISSDNQETLEYSALTEISMNSFKSRIISYHL